MFALGVAVQLVFIRSLRSEAGRGAVAARHLGARARDRGRCSSVVYKTTYRATNPSYADTTWTVAGYQISEVRVLAFAALDRDPRPALAAADADAARPLDPRDGAEPGLGAPARRRRRPRLGDRLRARDETAAAAGAVYGVLYPFNPGSHYDLISRLLSIVVLGGLGSLGGAVLAALADGRRRGGRRGRDLADVGVVLVLRRPDRAAARAAAGLLRRRRSGRCEAAHGASALGARRRRPRRARRAAVRRSRRTGSSTCSSSPSCTPRSRARGTSSPASAATSRSATSRSSASARTRSGSSSSTSRSATATGRSPSCR